MGTVDLSLVTLIVPVRSESALTRRLSSYYDGSSVNLAIRPRPDLNADEVVRQALGDLQTPFAGIIGDDDLLLKNFLVKAALFLNDNPRSSACHGRGFVMDLRTGACGPYESGGLAQRHQFSLWRTDALRLVYETASRAAAFWQSRACPDYASRELLLSWIAQTRTISTLKEFAIVRGAHPGRHDGNVVINHVELIDALNKAGLDGETLWAQYRDGPGGPGIPFWWPLKSPQRPWSPLHADWRTWQFDPNT
jgi:hypothetical protein